MKHAILGAGAIGGLLGTVLGSLGEDVTVVVRTEKLASYPAKLTLERPSGMITASVKAVAALAEPLDVLWIATKTYQLQTALEVVHSSPGCVVPLLNGVDHVAVLRARFGSERVVPGTIAVEAERIAPGRFIRRSPFVSLQPRWQRRAAPGRHCRTVGRVGICLQVHSERADAAVGQALFPWTDCAGDVGIGDDRGRNSSGRRMEIEIEFHDSRGMCRGERQRRRDSRGADSGACRKLAAGHEEFDAERRCRRATAGVGCDRRPDCARRRTIRDRRIDHGGVDGGDSREEDLISCTDAACRVSSRSQSLWVRRRRGKPRLSPASSPPHGRIACYTLPPMKTRRLLLNLALLALLAARVAFAQAGLARVHRNWPCLKKSICGMYASSLLEGRTPRLIFRRTASG